MHWMQYFSTVAVVAIAASIAYRLRSAHHFGTDSMASTRTAGKQWADGPILMIKMPMFETEKDDTFTKGATHMALMHNAVLRGYNTMYLQASKIQEEDYADFIGYATTWCNFVISHHDSEEKELFPKTLEVLGMADGDKEIWGHTHEEHEALVTPVSALKEYLTSLPSPSSLSKETLITNITSIQSPLETHFHSEIRTIHSLAARFGNYPAADATFQAWGKKSIMSAGVTDVVPFMLFNLDRSYEGGKWKDWPPMPGFVRWGIGRTAVMMHPGWWRFASCDVDGGPKDLEFP